MNDKEQIVALYHDMYAAMVAKDEAELDRVHADSFVLVHMTGMRQDKKTYIRAIMDGTLNYYTEKTHEIEVEVDGDTATMTGRSYVSAAVFGGRRSTWRLTLRFDLQRLDGVWKLTRAQATTW